jgi:hypothetical protein
VIIEELQNGRNVEILRRSVQENSLSISLRPGQYRYQVRVYNLLDKLEYTMAWTSFEVLPALQPKIQSIAPAELVPNTENQGEITITGDNIAPGADITLIPRGGGQALRPRHIELEGDNARLSFNNGELGPGEYDVIIKNPGGLDSQGTLVLQSPKPEIPAKLPPEIPAKLPAEVPAKLPAVEPMKAEEPEVEIVADIPEESEAEITADAPEEPGESSRPDIIISVGYSPLIPLYGVLFVDDAFESPFFPLGAAARIGIIPFKRGQNYLGAEVSASWNKLGEQKDEYDVSAQVMGIQLNLLYQLWLPSRTMAFNFRIGAGVNIIKDFYFDNGSGPGPSISSFYLSLGAGASFRWHITGHFFIEAGADFTHILDTADSSPPGYLRPVAGAGWRF